MARKLPKARVRNNNNRLDQKILCLFEDIKDEIVSIAESYRLWWNSNAIEWVATYLRDQWNKRTWFRIPDNYIDWFNSAWWELIDKPDFTNVSKVWESELEVMQWFKIKLWPLHLKSVEEQIALARWKMDERLIAMTQRINLVKGIRDKEQVARILLTRQTVDAKVTSLIQFFKSRNITMFVDKSGRRWSIEAYSKLAVRTNLAVSYNQWLINRKLELWEPLLIREEIIDSRTCPICIERNGEIRDMSEQWIPPLIFHFNCRGRWRWYSWPRR